MSQEYDIQYGRGSVRLTPPSCADVQLIEPRIHPAPENEAALVRQALDHPIDSPTLRELTRDVKKILIITNDNTRPLPSRITLPAILDSFYYPASAYDVTILIATGLHRKMTSEEMVEQYGREITEKYKIVNHVASDDSELVFLGVMRSGNELWVNRLVAESDLVIAEGFIESHFFAGFSGGRKSILPGVSGAKTIMNNHSPENIADVHSFGANLNGNPIHEECLEAAGLAKLRFILNVALNKEKKIIGAFAGHPANAHLKGCAFVKESMSVAVRQTDIVVTSNNGYPLDRNLYQAVKGIDVASRVAKQGGVIIMAAECADGVGHKKFRDLIQSCRSIEELNEKMSAPPSEVDKWQVQVLARARMKCEIILVSGGLTKEEKESLFLTHAADMDEALAIALRLKGGDADLSVIPEGPVVIPVVAQEDKKQ